MCTIIKEKLQTENKRTKIKNLQNFYTIHSNKS